MKLKTFLTISIVSFYVVFIGLVIKTIKEDFSCFVGRDSACFRFCSDDTEEYSDEFLLQEFNKSESAKRLKYNNVNIYRGYPFNGGMEFLYPNDNITSGNPPYSFYRGSVYIKNERYDFRRYCLEKSEYVIDGWKVMICNQDKLIHKVIHFIAIFISIIFFGLTLLAHIYFKELRDFYGKCGIVLVANQILTYILSTCVDLYDFYYENEEEEILYMALQLSVIHTLLWITVLIVHSLFTFITYKNRSTAPFDFSTYAIYVVASIVVSGIILYSPSFRYEYTSLYIACFIVSILNFIFVIVTIFNVFALTRHPTYSTQARFHYERKSFWVTVKLALIFLIIWITKFISKNMSFNFILFVTTDLLMLLTALIITLMLLGRKNIRTLIVEKYHVIKNVEKEIIY